MTPNGRGEKRALVTGGAGFIGSHVCDAYLAAGWRVTAVDDLSTGRRSNLSEAVELVEMDIRSDDLPRLVRDGGYTVVNHHAAQIDVRLSVRDPRRDASLNVDGLLNVLESARAAGVPRVIFISSGGVVYGEPDELPVSEEAEKRPLSPYGVTKLVGEHYLQVYRKLHGMEAVALRYSNVYGPRQDPHGEAGVVAIFARRVLEGAPLTIYGDGEQTRDYVFVGDVAKANLVASEIPLNEAGTLDDHAYNVGTGKETSVNDLARAMMRVTGREVPIERAPARPGELRANVLAIGRALGMGWAPERSLEEGLDATARYIAESEA